MQVLSERIGQDHLNVFKSYQKGMKMSTTSESNNLSDRVTQSSQISLLFTPPPPIHPCLSVLPSVAYPRISAYIPHLCEQLPAPQPRYQGHRNPL